MAMHQNLSMHVNIKPKDLIKALEKNKEKHLAEYEKALKVYFADLCMKLQELLVQAEEKNSDINYGVNLITPINNEKLYDKYIGMFKMATDEVIEISTEDYGCIVDDNWDWAVSASRMNTFYSSRAR